MRWKEALKGFAGIALIGVILYFVGIPSLIGILKSTSLFWFSVALVGSVASLFLAALSIHVLVRTKCGTGLKISTVATIKAWMVGLVGLGKLGELSSVFFLEDTGLSFGARSSMVLFDKGITFMVLLVIATVSSVMFMTWHWFVALLAIGLMVSILFVLFLRLDTWRVWVSRKLLGKHAGKMADFTSTLRDLSLSAVVQNILLTVVRWVLLSGLVIILFRAVGEPSPGLVQVLFVDSLVTLVSLIPVSIAGLGTKEGVAILLFGQIGVAAPVVLSIYFLKRAINYLPAILFLPLFIKWRRKETMVEEQHF